MSADKDFAIISDKPVASASYPMTDGMSLPPNAPTTTINITGIRLHRTFAAEIKFYGPPPFYLDTDEMTAVDCTINGVPTKMRFRFECGGK